MCNCQALKTSIERLDKLVDRTAALARILGDRGNAREHVLDPVVKFCNEHPLVLIRPLALRNVGGKALDAYRLPSCIELDHRCFLEPRFATAPMRHAEGDRIRWLVGSNTSQLRFVVREVRGVNQLAELSDSNGRLRVVSKNRRCVLAV